MITSMRGCVACNNLSPRPISSRSLSHDFAIKLLKYGTSFRVCSRANTVVYGFILYLIKMTTSIRGCVTYYELWPRPISLRSISREFAIKLLKYYLSGHVRSTSCIILDELFPYLAQMITSMRGCVAHIDRWSWPLNVMLFSCDVAYFMDDIHIWHEYNPWRDDVPRTIPRLIGQRSMSHIVFTFLQSGWGYPSISRIYNF